MSEGWNDLGFTGKGGRFWVEMAERAFSTKLCLPEKGDAGEIFAALYMLLCGDIIRKENDQNLESFAISIDDWFVLLKNGGERATLASKEASSNGKTGSSFKSFTT